MWAPTQKIQHQNCAYVIIQFNVECRPGGNLYAHVMNFVATQRRMESERSGCVLGICADVRDP